MGKQLWCAILLIAAIPSVRKIPADESQLHHYLEQCALRLIPNWSYGSKLTEREQEALSACLAAFTNGLNKHVAIGLFGPDYLSDFSRFPYREGCFFGNLYKGHVYAGDDRDGMATSDDADLRVCSLPEGHCAPIIYAGKCKDICTSDPSRLFYTKCYVGEKAYTPLSTRLHGTTR